LFSYHRGHMADGSRPFYDRFLKKAPQQGRSRSVVEAVLEAAAEGLGRTGSEDDLRLQDVAARAGVGVGSLYDYFRDRQSVMSAFAAKITEDNLRSFEAVLDRTHAMPLREGIEAIVDHALATYGQRKRLARVALRVAVQIGLMPALAHNQNLFAGRLEAALRKRMDLGTRDPKLAAWVLTHGLMGVVNTLLWDDAPPLSESSVRRAFVDMAVDHLSASDAPASTEDPP
jgi:AcrR family transcriptional regulator